MQLIYSANENIWYWQRYADWAVSQEFKTESKAKLAKRNNKLVWS